MKVYRNDETLLDNNELVTLGQTAAGTAGAILGFKFDAVGHGEGYLEACMRFYPNSTATNPLFLSSIKNAEADGACAAAMALESKGWLLCLSLFLF